MDTIWLNVLERSHYTEILQLCKTNRFLRGYCKDHPTNIIRLVLKSAGFKSLKGHDLKQIFKFLYKENKQLEDFLIVDLHKKAYIIEYPIFVRKFLWQNCVEFNCSGFPLKNLPEILLTNTSLQKLDCHNTKLGELPTLPKSLKHLNCSENNLTHIGNLPPGLQYLDCNSNILVQLPDLPVRLQYLDCSAIGLAELPDLPVKLLILRCGFNELTQLPTLPPGLKELDCGHNFLNQLDNLPFGLRKLKCFTNQLTQLLVPPNLEYLDCQRNRIQQLNLPDTMTDLYVDITTTLVRIPRNLNNHQRNYLGLMN